VPEQRLCCGRPLYDYGMLDQAKRQLHQAIEALRPAVRAGIPVVGLEPSCVSVFRDEMLNLLPHDEDAQRLAHQTKTLAELLGETEGWTPPRLERKALVHGHCHHRAIIGFQNEVSILNRMGIDSEVPDPGCCGMAGSFGFEAPHYDVSMKVGEQRILPAVRKAEADRLIIADGFSCHEQILQGTGRKPLHIAQVLQMALRESPYLTQDHGPSILHPRLSSRVPQMDGHDSSRRRQRRRIGVGSAVVSASLLAGGLLAWQMLEKKSR
jgi:Fe-S oxidoreductase